MKKLCQVRRVGARKDASIDSSVDVDDQGRSIEAK